MTETRNRFSDAFAAMSSELENSEIREALEQLDHVQDQMKRAGEPTYEPSLRLPYSGAEPLLEAVWK